MLLLRSVRRCRDGAETADAQHRGMAQSEVRHSKRPVHSYILRVLEQRVLTVSLVYELHDIASGTKRSFKSLDELQRHLAQRARSD